MSANLPGHMRLAQTQVLYYPSPLASFDPNKPSMSQGRDSLLVIAFSFISTTLITASLAHFIVIAMGIAQERFRCLMGAWCRGYTRLSEQQLADWLQRLQLLSYHASLSLRLINFNCPRVAQEHPFSFTATHSMLMSQCESSCGAPQEYLRDQPRLMPLRIFPSFLPPQHPSSPPSIPFPS